VKTLQQISDRIEIEELFIKYAYAIDERNYDELDDVFLPDAVFDNTAVGGPRSDWPTMKKWLAIALANYAGCQHVTTSTRIDIKGDEAFTKTACFNPMVVKDNGGIDQQVFFVGVWYLDHLVRTPQGWRIKERKEQRSWFFNARETMPAVPPPLT
jgi:hypothetical protein